MFPEDKGWRRPLDGLFMVIMIPLFLFPLGSLIRLSGVDSKTGWLSGMAQLWQARWFLASVATSLHLALTSVAITAAAGTLIAFAFRLFPIPARSFLLRAMDLMVAFPSFLVAFSLIYLYGSSGAVTVGVQHMMHLAKPPWDFLYSAKGIVMAEVIYYLPFMLRPLFAVVQWVDASHFEAAANLGANRFKQVWRVLLPLSLPGITAGAVLAFLFILNEFGILLILGSQSTPTVPVSIYNHAMINLNLPQASREALSMLLFILVIYLGYRILYRSAERRFAQAMPQLSLSPAAASMPSGAVGRTVGAVISGVLALAFFLPVVVVALSSVASNWMDTVLPSSLTGRWFAGLSGSDWHAIFRTLVVSAVASAAAVGIGMLGAWLVTWRKGIAGGIYDALLTLPQTVPSVVIGLALLMAYDQGRFNLSGPVIVVFAQTTLILPTAYRTLVAAMSKLPPSYPEAAQALGATPARAFWRVTLPLLAPATKSAFGLAFALSAGELGATLMVYPPGFTTAPIQIVEYVERGFYAEGAALAVVMLGALAVVLTAVAGVPWRTRSATARRTSARPAVSDGEALAYQTSMERML